ncbi:MAG: ATP-binding protein [Lewinellaceae bacterium]|nr:ATP-binding protein [Lewinellaceae bacterium]
MLTTDFDEWESEGTKKLFYLSAFLLQTLKDGDVLFIDEFDARLHPLLTKKSCNFSIPTIPSTPRVRN